MREAEGLIYIGNSKALQSSKPVSKSDVDVNLDNVPVREKQNINEEPSDDLPF
jgi:hypothetical protein